jgi:hypothetical protein
MKGGGRSLVSVSCSRVWCSPASSPILSPPCSSACTKPKVSCGTVFCRWFSGEVESDFAGSHEQFVQKARDTPRMLLFYSSRSDFRRVFVYVDRSFGA